MTIENKQLLLKDLCARLPYGVKMQFSEKFPEWFTKKHGEGTTVTPFTLDVSSIGFVMININNDVNDVKPYLRPMSSMSKKEKNQYHSICDEEEREEKEFGEWVIRVYYHNTIESIDWLNVHHFDFRNLIGKGLALEAPEGMYKTK